MADSTAANNARDRVRIGLVSVSDRASAGVYEDKGIPALREWLSRAIRNPIDWETRLIADERPLISETLRALVINLPGQPKAIAETLGGLASATPPVPGIFAAVPYCVDLIGGPYIETDDAVCAAFRPKSAVRAPRSP